MDRELMYCDNCLRFVFLCVDAGVRGAVSSVATRRLPGYCYVGACTALRRTL